MIESLFKIIPLKLNPIYSIIGILVLAYIPHGMKKPLLEKKLKKSKMEYATANSRGLSAMMIDDSSEGMKIANLAGCHQNGLEAFSYFSAAIGSCLIMKVDREVVEGASALFVIIRLFYTYVYMSSLNGKPRTLLFFAGGFLNLALLVVAGYKYSTTY